MLNKKLLNDPTQRTKRKMLCSGSKIVRIEMAAFWRQLKKTRKVFVKISLTYHFWNFLKSSKIKFHQLFQPTLLFYGIKTHK